jgi:hypothetical protein
MRFDGNPDSESRSCVWNSTPSKRRSPPNVATQSSPLGVWTISLIVPCGSPSAIVQTFTRYASAGVEHGAAKLLAHRKM